MPFDARELFARIIQCEAGGEGDDGMRAVATVIMNRTNIDYGEFGRVNNGGDLRSVITQPGQFNCMKNVLAGQYNAQNVWNMDPQDVHYNIADWAISGGILSGVDNSLFFYNPYSPKCADYFPPGGAGVIRTRVNQHCFYSPTEKYRYT